MSELTLSPTSNSITANVRSFLEEDRVFDWYLDGTLKDSYASQELLNSYRFEPVPFWSPHTVNVKIYNADKTILYEDLVEDTVTTFANLAAFDWNASNGEATAQQTQAAYTAATTKGLTEAFNHAVWNDIIAYIIEARQQTGQPMLSNVDMTMQALDPLTAIIMNAAVKNVDYPWWTWRDDPYDYDIDGRYISYLGRLAFQRGDVVFGRYIIELVKNLNIMRQIYSGRNLGVLDINHAVSLGASATIHNPQTLEIFSNYNLPLTYSAKLQFGTGKELKASTNIPLTYSSSLELSAKQRYFRAQIQQLLSLFAKLGKIQTKNMSAEEAAALAEEAILALTLPIRLRENFYFHLNPSATLGNGTPKILTASGLSNLSYTPKLQTTTGKLLNASQLLQLLFSGALELEEPYTFNAVWNGLLSSTNLLELGNSLLPVVRYFFHLGGNALLSTDETFLLTANTIATLGQVGNLAALPIAGVTGGDSWTLTPAGELGKSIAAHISATENHILGIVASAEREAVKGFISTLYLLLAASNTLHTVASRPMVLTDAELLDLIAEINSIPALILPAQTLGVITSYTATAIKAIALPLAAKQTDAVLSLVSNGAIVPALPFQPQNVSIATTTSATSHAIPAIPTMKTGIGIITDISASANPIHADIISNTTTNINLTDVGTIARVLPTNAEQQTDSTLTLSGELGATNSIIDFSAVLAAHLTSAGTLDMEGGVMIEPLNVSANGTYTAPAGKAYTPVSVVVPNTYTAGDEGKVVDNGTLVAQTSESVYQNDTYDTTGISELTVDVPVFDGTVAQALNVFVNGTYTAPAGNAYTPVVANVPNTYSAEEEGLVVIGGELVGQTSRTVTENDETYTTTTNDSLTVAFPVYDGTVI